MIDAYTTNDQSCCVQFGQFVVCVMGEPKKKGGGKMAAKKISKAAPKKKSATKAVAKKQKW